ncbi:MAG: hypothetical protein KBS93_01425 [Flavobacteriaceae bacterium]|nr:hypothetical protein [Candidatus Onthonaster equi]
MSKTLHAIILFLLSFCGYSQQVMITGKVEIDNVDEPMNLSTIIIENLSTFSKTKANDGGIFSIKASEGDILQFTSGFTTERNIKITSSILSKGFIQVHLDLEVIELAEANLNTLKRNLKDNINTNDNSKDQLYKSLGLDPNLQYMKIDPSYTSQVGGGYGPISSLIGLINGSTKRAKRTYAAFQNINGQEKIKSYFEDNFFMEYLKIPSHKIQEYINYCYINFDLKKLVDQGRFVEIEEILKNNSSTYIQQLNN